MRSYDHKTIEAKWRAQWEKEGTYRTRDDSTKPKAYILDMFPYPSGDGLHVGHPKGYIATDIYSRYKRMNGYNVLHPMGWDAFGLPAENYAIKNKVHPRVAVEKNIVRFKEQLSLIGLDYDWTREINTTDPSYYRWTQWIFLKLLEKGLAYESTAPINWCPSCQTGLANEDVEYDGTCERCGTKVEKRPMRQWVLKITAYADRLLDDLTQLSEWPEHIKEQQRNWIGRSEGAEIDFPIAGSSDIITVFTTRPDTIHGATFLVVAPEHPLVTRVADAEVHAYVEQAKMKSDIERTGAKKKTGVLLKAAHAVHPASQKEIPIFVADYVLSSYGTGAIMAVPDIDERDGEFAEAVGAPVVETKLVSFDEGVRVAEGRKKIQYRLQDWVFSRQRYWGEPIPVVHCEKDGVVPVPYAELPVMLPEVEHYEPAGTGESPLATISEWVNTACPTCGGPAKRETNTMPQWAGSSWYYLRYIDPENDAALVDSQKERYWAPVDLYVGGAEHATRHLIYARFWHKFLKDIGVVSTSEPFTELHSVGLVLAEDGRKMSKRYGNVVNPDDVIERFGADSLRVYEMFMGPFGNAIAWSTDSLIGARRFIERVSRLSVADAARIEEVEPVLHQTIKKVSEDIEAFKFNTAIAQLMTFMNIAEKSGIGEEQFEIFLTLLAPFAPHLAEELWSSNGHTTSIHLAPWPLYDMAKITREVVELTVQVDGKRRGTLFLPVDTDQDTVLREALLLPAVQKALKDRAPARVVYVAGKIVNLVKGRT